MILILNFHDIFRLKTMKFPRNGFVFFTLLFVSTFAFLTLNEVILTKSLQVKAQNLELANIKKNDLLAEKVQYPRTSNIRILKEAFKVNWIPAGSMEPTLHGTPFPWKADWVLIDKLIYRSKLPKRGDIILFEPTENLLREQFTTPFIKRIIALPGEKVELKNGKVYINNKPLQEEKYKSAEELTSVEVCIPIPEQPYLAKSQIIPPDSYLVMGDKRGSSYDSRCWGVVPRKNIIGKIVRKVWSLDKKDDFTETRNSQQRNSEDLFLKNIGFSVAPNQRDAIDYLQKKLVITKLNKDVINQSIILRSLIIYYLQSQQIDKAINYSQQFLTAARENKILGAQTQALGLLSLTHLINKSYDSSIDYGQKALAIAQKVQDYNREYASLISLALANMGKNNCSEANDFYRQSLSVLPLLNQDYQKLLEKQLLSLFPEGKIKSCLKLAARQAM